MQVIPLRPLAPNPTSKLNILGHDCDPLGMNSAQVGVLEQPNQVSLGRFLQSRNGTALEAEIGLEVLGNLSHQPLERKFPDKKLRALLVLPDLPQCHRPGPEPVWLLHSSGGGSRLPSGLGRELLPRSLPSSRLASRLLGTGHLEIVRVLKDCLFILEKVQKISVVDGMLWFQRVFIV